MTAAANETGAAPAATGCCAQRAPEPAPAPADPARVHLTDSRLRWSDRLGAWKVRWGIGRMAFRVEPGLHALGGPGPDDPVLVTANYKMSFDAVRTSLPGRRAWILVLDTKGVNVWCAAGKGSFGTQELVQRVAATRLKERVAHRTLILPQLGAPGVSAPVVKAFSGFKVAWGPVRAADLPAYLDAGLAKTPEMARVRFGLVDRLVLTPIELVQSIKWLPAFILLALGLALPADSGFAARLAAALPACLAAIPLGAVAFPLLLPVLPFKSFAWKGFALGLIGLGGLAAAGAIGLGAPAGAAGLAGQLLLLAPPLLMGVPAVIWLAMNFTGSTTFTCQTGANREVENAVIPLVAAAGLGLLAAIARIVLSLAGVIA